MTESTEQFNPYRPARARRYDWWLGGKDNFAADRASADAIRRVFPPITVAAAQNRRCLLRVVRYLVDECGIRQFLDIGSGGPIGDNVHNVAQRIAPECRIVYVDNDPLVAVHTRALCVSDPKGAVTFHPGDLRSPRQILTADAVRNTLDLTQPTAVLLFAVLHFLPDSDKPHDAVSEILGALPAGSYLAMSHATYDPLPAEQRADIEQLADSDSSHGPFQPRSRDQFGAFLEGLDLVEPGIVSTVRWRPDLEPTADVRIDDAEAICYAAVGSKR